MSDQAAAQCDPMGSSLSFASAASHHPARIIDGSILSPTPKGPVLMPWTAPVTGIAVSHFAASLDESRMSEFGYEPSCQEGAGHDSNTLDSGSQTRNVNFR